MPLAVGLVAIGAVLLAEPLQGGGDAAKSVVRHILELVGQLQVGLVIEPDRAGVAQLAAPVAERRMIGVEVGDRGLEAVAAVVGRQVGVAGGAVGVVEADQALPATAMFTVAGGTIGGLAAVRAGVGQLVPGCERRRRGTEYRRNRAWARSAALAGSKRRAVVNVVVVAWRPRSGSARKAARIGQRAGLEGSSAASARQPRRPRRWALTTRAASNAQVLACGCRGRRK